MTPSLPVFQCHYNRDEIERIVWRNKLKAISDRPAPVSCRLVRFRFWYRARTYRQANLKSAYYKLDNDKLSATSNPSVYKKLLFALCFFHASVQVHF